MHAGTAVLTGAVVFEMGLGQWFDVICSLVTMPEGFALFEGCWLSHVAPCFLSMIEARLREDETEWDREVNEDLLCLEVIFTTSWIIQWVLHTLHNHGDTHSYMETDIHRHTIRWKQCSCKVKKQNIEQESLIAEQESWLLWNYYELWNICLQREGEAVDWRNFQLRKWELRLRHKTWM